VRALRELRELFASLVYFVIFMTLLVISAIGIAAVLKITLGSYFDSEVRFFIGTVGGLFIAALCVIGWKSISRPQTPSDQ
jgi:hypothetical protein